MHSLWLCSIWKKGEWLVKCCYCKRECGTKNKVGKEEYVCDYCYKYEIKGERRKNIGMADGMNPRRRLG